MKYLAILVPLVLLASCGKKSDSSSSAAAPSSDFNEAYERLQESAPELEASKSTLANKASLSLWDNATMTFMGVNSAGSNPQGFVTDLVDGSVEQSIFERARMPFLISCCMDILANKTGALFTTGTQTITFTSAVVGVCGESSDFTDMIGEQISIVVTNLSDTTNYDQMIFFDHATNPLFSNADQWMYVKNNDTVLNFLHMEDTSASFDGSDLSISSIAYDKADQDGVFQFISKSTNDTKLFRIFMDAAGDDVRIFAYKRSPNGSNPEVAVNLASTFEEQTQAAISMTWANMSAPYNVALNNGNACIQTSDVSIATDDTLTCAAIGKTVGASSGVLAGIGATVQALNGNTVRTAGAAGDLDDNLPTFDASTILTAGLGL
jgi:hypothetical protein